MGAAGAATLVGSEGDPAPCGACSTRRRPAETTGRPRPSTWWLIEQRREELHPILAPGARGGATTWSCGCRSVPVQRADGSAALRELRLDIEPGFHVLKPKPGEDSFCQISTGPAAATCASRSATRSTAKARRGPPDAHRDDGPAARRGRGHRRAGARGFVVGRLRHSFRPGGLLLPPPLDALARPPADCWSSSAVLSPAAAVAPAAFAGLDVRHHEEDAGGDHQPPRGG